MTVAAHSRRLTTTEALTGTNPVAADEALQTATAGLCPASEVKGLTIDELQRKRQGLVHDARGITEKARDENRALTADEVKAYDALMERVDGLKATIDAQLGPAQNIDTRENPGYPGSTIVEYRDGDVAILSREQRFADVARSRGVAYAAEARTEPLRFGRIVRALATGDQRGMSDVERRAMASGVDAVGGWTVPEILASEFIDRARNAAVIANAGARFVPMTSDTLAIARLATGPSLAWKQENAAITSSDMTLERVQFTAKTLPVLCKMSVELAEDSANIDQIIERELSQALALELDRAALRGGATNVEPTGILNQANVGSTTLGAGNGLQIVDADWLLDALFSVASANFTPNARIYAARTAKSLAKLKDNNGRYQQVPDAVAQVPAFITNAIPINLTVGTSTDCTEAYIGNFGELMVGVRTSFRLEVSRTAADSSSSAFSNLQIFVRAYLRADVQLAHPAAFQIVKGIR